MKKLLDCAFDTLTILKKSYERCLKRLSDCKCRPRQEILLLFPQFSTFGEEIKNSNGNH